MQASSRACRRNVPGIAADFEPVEAAITRSFLPALLEEEPESEAVVRLRELMSLSVWHAGLGVPDPKSTGELVTSLTSRSKLHTVTCKARSSKLPQCFVKEREEAGSVQIEALKATAGPTAARRMERAHATGAWLTAMPYRLNRTDLSAYRLNGTDLSADEFRDSLRLRLGLTPPPCLPDVTGANRCSLSHTPYRAKKVVG
jgi:hypothetical protein